MRRFIGLVLLVVSCGGSTDGDTAAISCDVTSAPLTTVQIYDWPDGLIDQQSPYQGLSGRYEGSSSCSVEPVSVKIVSGIWEDVQILDEPYATGSQCGCLIDPDYGSDTEEGAIARFTNFEFYIENLGDPGSDGQTLTGEGALFGNSSSLDMRACGEMNIDPVRGSAYTRLQTVVRQKGGSLEATVILSDEAGEELVCEITGLTLVPEI